MKRRSFLAMLGLAPVASAVTPVAAASIDNRAVLGADISVIDAKKLRGEITSMIERHTEWISASHRAMIDRARHASFDAVHSGASARP